MICRELGRKEKESLQKMAEIAKEGFLLKQQLIQEAKRGLEDKKVNDKKIFGICVCKNQDLELWNMDYRVVKYVFIQIYWRLSKLRLKVSTPAIV